MSPRIYVTPGVYIEEKSAFPNSVVAVPTAVPAFIGYTQKAEKNKKDITHKPVRLSSFSEFQQYFGEAPDSTFSIKSTDDQPGFELAFADEHFLLYHSMKLFYANGGADCYVVSIGNYSNGLNKNDFFGFSADGEPKGINTLLKEGEPTMLVIPDLMLLRADEASAMQVKMLEHCGNDTKSRIAILDVHDGYKEGNMEEVIKTFRDGIGSSFLGFGAAYFNWLHTTITGSNDFSFENIQTDSLDDLRDILKLDISVSINTGKLDQASADKIIGEVEKLADESVLKTSAKQLHQTLIAVHPLYKSIVESIAEKINLLPPSAAMAGIYTMVDNNIGVFQSPANVSVGSVVRPAVDITNEQQENLNVPLNGKAVNAIRTFPGKGVLVWGARTLDGNNQDWRYISVRRTVIMIEQSVKNATEAYVFEPNTASTWANLKAMLNNFLTNVWSSGALAGATPEDAFSVKVGLGETMTPADILEGIMRISVQVAITRPAEFIVITFEQQMQKS